MKKNTYNTDGLSAEDRALNTFAELMIEKIRNLQEDWKKPWFSPQVAQLPKKPQWSELQWHEQHCSDAHAGKEWMADFPLCHL